MSRAKSVVVVGGGVVGLSIAWYVRQRGHSVTVVDRGPADRANCSRINAGMIVPSHIVPLAAPGMIELGLRMLPNPESPFSIRPRPSPDLVRWGLLFMRNANTGHVERSAPLLRDLNLESRRCYEEFADRFGNTFDLVKKGLLMLFRSEQALREEARIAERARTLGIPADVLTAEATAKLDPAVRMDIVGSVHFPQDCHFSPQRFLERLTGELLGAGVTLHADTEVTGWRVEGGRVTAARTRTDDLPGDEFVLAGGAWSPETVRELGIRLPMQAGKGYSLTLDRPPQQPTICSILTEARVAITPMGSSLRVGGTMEITGNDLSVNERRVEGIRKSVPLYFPEFKADDLRSAPVRSGLRPCSPDGLPYVGRFARFENLSVATGHAMMGMSLGPITGKLIAELLSDETPSVRVEALSPDRFGGHRR
ncbi:MAG: FAD-dependent oxidoreductase [Capsulimonadales bacterium]|nr:FAD-dependent oxidoreductase [Capsulimonadales bacterium]